MQGQLTGGPATVKVKTLCAHCGEAIHMEIDGAACAQTVGSEANPLTFIPDVDFSTLPDKCITDAF